MPRYIKPFRITSEGTVPRSPVDVITTYRGEMVHAETEQYMHCVVCIIFDIPL